MAKKSDDFFWATPLETSTKNPTQNVRMVRPQALIKGWKVQQPGKAIVLKSRMVTSRKRSLWWKFEGNPWASLPWVYGY